MVVTLLVKCFATFKTIFFLRYLKHIDSDDETDSSEDENEAPKDEKPSGSEEKIKTLSISCYLNR